MRSVNNKSNDILLATNSIDVDIIALSETWLSKDQCDSEFLDKKYKSFRKDRSDSDVDAERGGGVLIALKNEIDCDQNCNPEMIGLEAVCVKVNLSDCALFVYCLYVQPSAPHEIYEKHLNAIDNIERNHNDIILILGDWNLPIINWIPNDESCDFLPVIGESQSEEAIEARRVTEFMLERGLLQVCDLKNKSQNVLDLIFTNMPELTLVQKSDMPLIPEIKQDVAHVPMTCFIECQPKIFQSSNDFPKIHCFKKANYEMINQCLDSINFHEVLALDNFDDSVNKFYDILYSIFDEHVPLVTLKNKNKPAWFDHELAKMKNERNKEYKKLSKLRSIDANADDSNFIKARDQFNECHKLKHEEFMLKMLAGSKENPKVFWQYINNKRINNALPCKLELDGEIAVDDANKTRLFAKFFSSVYVDHTHDDDLNNFIDNRIENNAFEVHPSHEAIFSVLRTIDTNKGIGTDKVSPLFLRKCAESLVEPLHILFQQSIANSVYPAKWKIGQITPIHKSGQRSNIRECNAYHRKSV